MKLSNITFLKQRFVYISVNNPFTKWILDIPLLQIVVSQVEILCLFWFKKILKVSQDTEKLLFSQLSDFLSLKSDRYKYFLSP